MKKVVLIFGSIAGAIVVGLMYVWMAFSRGTSDFEGGELVGYLGMIIALSTIFFGIKSYRDTSLGGVITFGKALLLGVLITLVASAIYVINWEIYFSVNGADFADEYFESSIEKVKASGVPEPELKDKIQEMEDMKNLYTNNTLFRVVMTFIEIFPVGLAISLISAGILRRKEILPA